MSVVLKDIDLSFGEKRVLDHFSLTLPTSGLVLITGPSGCGKTTLLKVIAGLITPDAGSVEGMDDKHISMVFADDVLLPWLTVQQNITLGVGENNMHAQEALALVGLEDSLQLVPDELSSGMQRRVAIARALTFNGDVLILDEPTNSLDATLAQTIMQGIADTWSNRLVVCVTHDTNVLAGYADKVIQVSGAPLQILHLA
jgi:ABC-type nitrate/sulfonate/bicarbonate transport system ATPase subunit